MDLKNLIKPGHLDADAWRQHLHRIDAMNRQADEHYAEHLTRLKAEARQGTVLSQPPQPAESTPLFWITGK